MVPFLHALFAFASYARGAPSSSSHLIVHESVNAPQKDWKFYSRAHGHEQLSLQIAVRPLHSQILDIAAAVSDPSSAKYGQYLDQAAMQAALPDLSVRVNAIEEWLHEEGATGVKSQGEWVTFHVSAEEARSLLDAKFAWYTSAGTAPVLRTLSYSVPQHLADTIDFIYPTVQFLKSGKTKIARYDLVKRLPPSNPNCTNSLCPEELKKLYHINHFPANNNSCSRIGVAGFLEEYINPADVATYVYNYGIHNTSTPYTFNIELISGGQNPQNVSSGGEATLDAEWVAALTNPLEMTYYSTGGRPPTWSQPGNKTISPHNSYNEPYLAFLEYLLADPNPPQVISISYTDTEQTVPLPYANKVCSYFGRLAARGVSVIVASGDGGAAGTDSATCTAPDGRTKAFLPTFPASCPWVTSVGATIHSSPPRPASYTSGGFSNYFGVPAWQANATKTYQAHLGTHLAQYYNASGRGIPDVSAVGDDYLVSGGGFNGQERGTSASTPAFAAIVALLNDLRLRKGMPVLGFLNPLLYSEEVSATFRDVVGGSAGGCSFADGRTSEGFLAVRGWDAASGLGVPDFERMRKVLT